MSGHRRVKNLDVDEDDFDDYNEYDEAEIEGVEGGGGEEEEMTDEDKEQMMLGMAKVRSALGDDFDVSDAQIQESLWHYWFDADKTIVYLKNQKTPQNPKSQPKQTNRFDQAASAAAQTPTPTKQSSARMDPAEWFRDVPWFNLPPNLSSRIVEPARPSLRMLGGSAPTGKPSKLAALAAARKKKEAEATENQKPTGTASLLERLGPKPATSKIETPSLEGLKISEKTYPVRKRKSPSPPPPIEERRPSAPEKQDPVEEPKPTQNLRTNPSIFAKTMIGARQGSKGLSSDFSHNLQSALYGSSYDHTETNPFSGPSPDDVVTQAQAKGAKKQSTPSKDGKGGITNGVAHLNVDDTPVQTKVKSKNLNVVDEYGKSSRKREASFVVIGHVDHGKSTLMGRLLYDLKVVDQRSMDKYRKEAGNIGKSSFALAWVMDSTTEERERGVTVDIATNHFETSNTKFTILDAPGHKDFVPNMIAGASQADFAVLVIDASTNSFEAGLRGQTKEHALLVRSMGVSRVIIAVNKMDTVDWAQERFEEIQQQLSAFMVSAGFKANNISFIPCAGLTGENIVTSPPQSASWYKSQTLVQALEAFEPSKAAMTQPFRLQISDVFRGGVQNPLSISGKIEAGTVQVGDAILAMPAGETATIKGIEIDNESRDWAVAGQIVDLHLTEIDPVHLKTGDIVCDLKKPVKNVKAFTTKILAFEHVFPMQVDVHRGRLHVPAKISALVGTLDKVSGNVIKNRPRVVQPGSVARVRVELDTAIPLEVPQRIVLRSGGATVAAGLLEQVHV